MSDRFVMQIGHSVLGAGGAIIPGEWAVIDSRNGLKVAAYPGIRTESGWRELCRLLNDIYEEGKRDGSK